MEDNTNSTRLELTKLKNELNITTKGLGLLKNKLEELIKVFFSIFNIYKNDNSAVTDYFKEIFDSFSKGLINTYTTSALNTSLCSKSYVTIKSENINIMNVIIPAVDTKIFKDNTYTIDKDFSIN
jgi:vacuolar-type H+-ATPase subunit D/Vma8